MALLFGAFQRIAELWIPLPEGCRFRFSGSLIFAGHVAGALTVMRSRLDAMTFHAQSNVG